MDKLRRPVYGAPLHHSFRAQGYRNIWMYLEPVLGFIRRASCTLEQNLSVSASACEHMHDCVCVCGCFYTQTRKHLKARVYVWWCNKTFLDSCVKHFLSSFAESRGGGCSHMHHFACKFPVLDLRVCVCVYKNAHIDIQARTLCISACMYIRFNIMVSMCLYMHAQHAFSKV